MFYQTWCKVDTHSHWFFLKKQQMICGLSSLTCKTVKKRHPKITLTCMFFSSKSHKKVWVLRKCPSFASGDNHGAHEKPTFSPRRKRKWVNLHFVPSWLGGGDFGRHQKEGENDGWSWDIERNHWKQHDQNALANLKWKVPWLPVTGKNGMSWDEHSPTRNVLFSTWPKNPSGEDFWTKNNICFTWVATKRSAANSSQNLGWFDEGGRV